MEGLLYTLEYAFGIITLLGGVIAIHEFGHFVFAKYCGARVDVFSIGFGPTLFKRKWGETEYCLSLIPLGGYVKIYGQDPDEVAQDSHPQPSRSLSHKSLLQRIGVFVGGPLFNFLLAAFIFTLIIMIGVPKLASYATRVVPATPAYEAGLRSGDKIVSMNGIKVDSFEQFAEVLAKKPKETVKLAIERGGVPQEITFVAQEEPSITPFGEPIMAGTLEGLEPLSRAPVVGSAGTNVWGLEHGDRIIEVQGTPINTWEELEQMLEKGWASLPAQVEVTIKRGFDSKKITTPDLTPITKKLSPKSGATEYMQAMGLYNSELFVDQVMGGQIAPGPVSKFLEKFFHVKKAPTEPSSPAAKAGIQKGDRLVRVNGKPIYSFEQLRAEIQHTGERLKKTDPNVKFESVLKLEIEREGIFQPLNLDLQENQSKDHLGTIFYTYTIGIQSQAKPQFPTTMLMERTLNPLTAIGKGVQETYKQSYMTLVGIKKIVTGEVSIKAVGGPIMIGKIAGDTYSSRGWRDFLRIMAIISISLGVFNLLPIPMLDGGHVVLALVEAVRGRPLSKQITEFSLKVGFSLLMLLIVFAIYNDIMRVLPF